MKYRTDHEELAQLIRDCSRDLSDYLSLVDLPVAEKALDVTLTVIRDRVEQAIAERRSPV